MNRATVLSALANHLNGPWMAPLLQQSKPPRLPTPGKRIKYAAKKRNKR